MNAPLRLSARVLTVSIAAASGLALAALTGCGAGFQNAATPTATSLAMSGSVHGGQQAISEAHVYLYAVSTSGSSNGTTSTSLLKAPGYVVSDGGGNFSITDDYTCPSGAYVYLLATGGNPGLGSGTNNTRISLAAGLGPCSLLESSSYFSVNELTTVAMAYSLAAFTTSETSIGSTSAFAVGIGNAFTNIPNLVNPTTGIAVNKTAGKNGIVPTQTLNTLGDILASCVNSDGTGSPCASLMTAANVTSPSPIDTFQAALNIAHNPGANVSTLYDLATATPPFQPTLAQAPNDWTISIQFSGALNPNLTSSANQCYDPYPNGGAFTDICQTQGISIDAAGNVWIANLNADANGGDGAVAFEQGNLVKFASNGVELSPAGGYTTPSLYKPQQMAFDSTGNIWVASRANSQDGNTNPDSVQEFTAAGVPLSGTQGFTGGGLNTPRALAIDAYDNVFAAGHATIAEFTNAGVAVSGAGYASSTLLQTFQMYFDSIGNLWLTTYNFQDGTDQYLDEFTPLGHSFNVSGTYGGTFTQTIADNSGTVPSGIAIDANNNIWLSNAYTGSFTGNGFVSEYSNAGALVSPTGGYTNAGITNPNNVVIDGSGNVFAMDSPLGEISNAGRSHLTANRLSELQRCGLLLRWRNR